MPSCGRRSMTPKGHAETQYPQPLHTSCCTTTVPNSVRNSDPVGQTSRHPAWVQCLQTSDIISHRKSIRAAPSPTGDDPSVAGGSTVNRGAPSPPPPPPPPPLASPPPPRLATVATRR